VRYAAVVVVAGTYVVGSGEPFQLITEPPFTKFVPLTINVKLCGLQFGTVEDVVVAPGSIAANEVIVGAGGWVIVNGKVWDVPPPGPGVNTFTVAVPGVRRSLDGTVARSWGGSGTEFVGDTGTKGT